MKKYKLPNKLQMANDIKQLRQENKKLRTLLKQKQTEFYQLKQKKDEYKAEFIIGPETFDELKILCEGIKGVEVYTEYISCHKLLFWKNGVISSETDDGEEIVYIENRTSQQIWNIIKNLIG